MLEMNLIILAWIQPNFSTWKKKKKQGQVSQKQAAEASHFFSFKIHFTPVKNKLSEPRLLIIKSALVTIITHLDLTPTFAWCWKVYIKGKHSEKERNKKPLLHFRGRGADLHVGRGNGEKLHQLITRTYSFKWIHDLSPKCQVSQELVVQSVGMNIATTLADMWENVRACGLVLMVRLLRPISFYLTKPAEVVEQWASSDMAHICTKTHTLCQSWEDGWQKVGETFIDWWCHLQGMS